MLPVLLTHAVRRLRRAGLAEGSWGRPSAAEAQGVVNQAIELALSGKRVWPDDLDFEGYLKGLIWSVVGNLKKAQAAVQKTELDEEMSALEAPIDQMLKHKRLLGAITALVADDEELSSLLSAIEDGHEKRAAIAEALGWTVDRVTLARTKLNRKLVHASLSFGDES
jgi:hypothetical protein